MLINVVVGAHIPPELANIQSGLFIGHMYYSPGVKVCSSVISVKYKNGHHWIVVEHSLGVHVCVLCPRVQKSKEKKQTGAITTTTSVQTETVQVRRCDTRERSEYVRDVQTSLRQNIRHNQTAEDH